MSNENIVIKGTPKKNKTALILLIAGISLVVVSLIVSDWAYQAVDLKIYYRVSHEFLGWASGSYKYDDSFIDFFFGEFFNFSCFYGYLLIVGIIAAVVGIIIKTSTEKCEITVTDSCIFGKLPHGKEVNIPLNQVTALNLSSFNGISVSSIGNVSNFHCFENRDEVMKAISYLLANPQQGSAQTAGANATATASAAGGTEAEQLKRLKDLLDSGVLTQKEFDAKKKQILGL